MALEMIDSGYAYGPDGNRTDTAMIKEVRLDSDRKVREFTISVKLGLGC